MNNLLEYIQTLGEYDEKVLSTNFEKEKENKQKNELFDLYKDSIESVTNFNLF